MSKGIWLIYLLVGIMWSCYKYEEDPIRSLYNPKDIIAREWRITSYRVDGVDSMWVIHGLHLGGNFDFYPHDDLDDLPEVFVFTKEDTTNYMYGSRWKYEKRNSEPMLGITFSSFRRNHKPEEFDDEMMPFKPFFWTITRLRDKRQMWLRVTENGKQYELEFTAVK